MNIENTDNEYDTGYNIMAVSNRGLCTRDYYECIEEAVQDGAGYLLLREKDLDYDEYVNLAVNVKEFLRNTDVKLILNVSAFESVRQIRAIIRDTGCNNIHIPYNIIKKNEVLRNIRKSIDGLFGISVHSREEALEAIRLKADYVIAGHIFSTACKLDVPPRGLDFLKEICETGIPVYAIGGMNKENAIKAVECNATGICIMSGYFK